VGKGVKAVASAASLVTGETNPYIEAAKGVGDVLGQFNDIIGNTEIKTAQTNTYAVSQCKGTAFSLDNWYDTDPADAMNYPGRGDVFVIFENVLFAYVFVDGKVILAPIGYGTTRKLVSSQLDGYLPAAQVTQYRELDPWFNPSINPETNPSAAQSSQSTQSIVPGKLSRLHGPRFISQHSVTCDIYGGEGNAITTSTFSSSGVSQTKTTTTVTKVYGLMAEFMGAAGESSESITYSSSKTNWTIDAQSAEIYLNCDASDGAFDVDIFFDTLFGTFFSVKGNPVDYFAGTVSDSGSRPVSNQTVTLKIGGQSYTAVTNQKGQFKFRLKAVPKSSGSLSVGASAVPVTYTGAPLTNLKLTVGVAPMPAPTIGQPGTTEGTHPSPAKACCPITAVDARTGLVTAKETATGKSFQFKVADEKMLKTLKVGQGIYANFKTQKVSVDGVKPCCPIVSLGKLPAAEELNPGQGVGTQKAVPGR